MKTIYKKTTTIIAIFALFFLYGAVIVFAVPPATQYVPGETLDPNCPPVPNTNCSVKTGWQFDIANNYIYNDTDFVGIGTSTPVVRLSVLDEINATDSSGVTVGSVVNRIINPTEDVTNSVYIGSLSRLDWNTNETAFDLSGIPFNLATLTGSSTLVSILGSGDIDTVSGADITTLTTDDTFTNSFTGNITDSLIGINNRIFSTTTGTVEEMVGLNTEINNLAPGYISYMSGANFKIAIDAGEVASVVGVSTDITNNNSLTPSRLVSGFRAKFEEVTTEYLEPVELEFYDVVTDSNVGIFAVQAGSDITPGAGGIVSVINIEADGTGSFHGLNAQTGSIAGLRIWGGGTNSYGLIAGEDAYGVYVGDYGLEGTNNEYGIYVSDLDANNYLSNGVRIGVDNDSYKLQGVTNGFDAELYFGTDLVASYTPSDERLKNNIDNTRLSIADLSDIRIVDFNYDQDIIHDNNKLHHGVIAQELEKIYPNAVKERIDGFKVVDYSALVPLLVKSIQELQSQLTNRAVDLIDNVRDLVVRTLTADRGQFNDELCVGDVCVTESQFEAVFGNLNSESSNENNLDNTSDEEVGNNDETLEEESIEDESGDTEEVVEETEITEEYPTEEVATTEETEITEEESTEEVIEEESGLVGEIIEVVPTENE